VIRASSGRERETERNCGGKDSDEMFDASLTDAETNEQWRRQTG